jgi:sporulation protein YlmC with PRC-barrel domain
MRAPRERLRHHAADTVCRAGDQRRFSVLPFHAGPPLHDDRSPRSIATCGRCTKKSTTLVLFLNGTKASDFRFPGDWSRSASRFPKRNDLPKEKLMLKYVVTAAAVTLLSVPAYAAQDTMPPAAKVETAVPANAVTVTDWYKQDVYDPNDNKIGQIKDVLVDKSGKIHSLVIGVGGFLGAGEKDVLVAFDAVQPTMKDRKMYLVMNTTKDSLKAAPGFKYDSDTTTWVPDNHSANNKMK